MALDPKRKQDMKIAVIGMLALALSFSVSTASAAEIKSWDYNGPINVGPIADGDVGAAANRGDRLQQFADAATPQRKPSLKIQAKSVAPKPTPWRYIQWDGRLVATALDLKGSTRAMLTYAGQNSWRFRVGKPKVKTPDYDIILLANQPNPDRMATLVCGKKHNTNTGIRLCTRSEGGTHPVMHIDNLDVSALGAETHLVVKLDDGKTLVFSMKGAKEAISRLKTIHKVPAASSN